MSPAAQAAIIGGIAGGVVGGVFTLLGAVLGLFGERWVRSRGEVLCALVDWKPYRTAVDASRPDGVQVQERRLQVTFSNRKEVPAIAWDMRVVFYEADQPFADWARPHMQFVDDFDHGTPLAPVDLPPGVTVTRSISVDPLRNEPDHLRKAAKLREVQEADRVEFVARMVGTEDVREPLLLWQDLTPWQGP